MSAAAAKFRSVALDLFESWQATELDFRWRYSSQTSSITGSPINEEGPPFNVAQSARLELDDYFQFPRNDLRLRNQFDRIEEHGVMAGGEIHGRYFGSDRWCRQSLPLRP
jgi:hypothetical protein